MTSADIWSLVGAIGVILLIITMGGGLLWFAHWLSRDRQQARAQRERDLNHQSSQPLPPAPSESSRQPTEPMIRWGDELQREEMSPTPPAPADRIRWGEMREGTEVPPVNDMASSEDETVRCPICRGEVDETTDHVFKCPGCENLYHQHCWDFAGHKCSICNYYAVVKCPICRSEVDESVNHTFKCPECDNLYHQHCWNFVEHKCRICGKETS